MIFSNLPVLLLKSKIKSTQIIILNFIFIIIIGTLLLLSPMSSNKMSFFNALFTATSSICSAGLTVTNYSQLKPFGKIIVITLAQLGALQTVTIIMTSHVIFGRRLTLNQRVTAKNELGQYKSTGIVSLLKKIIITTFLIEAIGALLFAICFYKILDISIFQAIKNGVFHSIASFTNTGISIFNTELYTFANNKILLIITGILIFLGSIGFILIFDVISTTKKHLFHKRFPIKIIYLNLTLNSKIVLIFSLFLLFSSTLFFFLLEFYNYKTIGNFSFMDKIINSFFLSINTRSGGFSTINQHDLNPGSQLMSIALMFIGGSPVSMAGGIKTITFGVILISIISLVKGQEQIVFYGRSISFSIVQKCITIIILYLIIITSAATILSVSEKHLYLKNFTVFDIFFEVVSATGTVGLSVGITEHLSNFGKVIISICMLSGRIGPITILVALYELNSNRKNKLKYPEEKIMVN